MDASCSIRTTRMSARHEIHNMAKQPLDEQGRSREGEPPDERDQAGEEKKIIHDPCHASPLTDPAISALRHRG
jgi:hypothetical protein